MSKSIVTHSSYCKVIFLDNVLQVMIGIYNASILSYREIIAAAGKGAALQPEDPEDEGGAALHLEDAGAAIQHPEGKGGGELHPVGEGSAKAVQHYFQKMKLVQHYI